MFELLKHDKQELSHFKQSPDSGSKYSPSLQLGSQMLFTKIAFYLHSMHS